MKSLKTANILVINSGSSSIKYRLFSVGEDRRNRGAGIDYHLLRKGLIEKIGQEDSGVKNHKEGIRILLGSLSGNDISAVGHRVVHGGIEFNKPTLITAEVIAKIRECFDLAPLHNPANLAGIEACQELLPDTLQAAVFDTAYHQTLKSHAYIYGLPYEYYEKYNLRKFGFHGTSHEYVAGEAARILKRPLKKLKLISCHLGNGCSIAAIENGRSVDTSMGWTPLEGLVMGTRCGDIDPALVIFLSKKERLDLDAIEHILNYKSGVRGISGLSNDMREINKAASAGNLRAKLAIEVFSYRVKKYIGSYIAALGGLDAIIFTAGIGENDKRIRTKILKGLFGFLDKTKVSVLVIPTNEELMIARQTYRLAKAAGGKLNV